MTRLTTLCLMMASIAAVGVVADALTVESGLVPYQVVQCDDEGHAALALGGTSHVDGALGMRVMGVQKEIVPWTALGKAAGGTWQGSLPSVPAGGPYRIDVRVSDETGKTVEETSVGDVLVGDIWVLAGQSNMQGVGNRIGIEAPHPQVHTFAMSYEWRLAQEPLHTLAESPDPVHANFTTDEERQNAIKGWRDGAKGAGLGLAFAKEMVARTGRPVGLVASAHGGTSMGQWDPALKAQGGASLYGSMLKQVQATGGKVRGVLWYQGESDASPDAQPIYREKMKQLVAAMRADLGVSDLPFYYVQIGRFPVNGNPADAWNRIQADELALEAEMAPGGMVPSVDLALDDGIHVGTPGLKTLGHRLAALAERDLFQGKAVCGPRIEKVETAGTPYGQQVRVKFASVNGGLQSAGRASGFSISAGPDAPDGPHIYKQEVFSDDPSVVVLWVEKLPDNAQLWYGRGFNPYCNIVDQANMGVPVMGPIPIPKP